MWQTEVVEHFVGFFPHFQDALLNAHENRAGRTRRQFHQKLMRQRYVVNPHIVRNAVTGSDFLLPTRRNLVLLRQPWRQLFARIRARCKVSIDL